MLDTCADLGFNSIPEKTVVPCTTLELLGIELDSVTQEARISQNRLDETLNLITSDVASLSLLYKETAPVTHWKTQIYLLGLYRGFQRIFFLIDTEGLWRSRVNEEKNNLWSQECATSFPCEKSVAIIILLILCGHVSIQSVTQFKF